jgi:hypothetical protein
MKLLRMMVFLGGVLIAFDGLAKYQQYGAFPYLNWLRQPAFPLGIVAAGLLLSMLACLPQRWVRRWVGKPPQRDAHVLHYLDEHRHRHDGHGEQP